MRKFASVNRQNPSQKPIPRRDWILLPLIGLLTVVLILGSSEWIARKYFWSSASGYERCMYLDPATGMRGIPNSHCWEKSEESSWVEYRFNSCGHRSSKECGTKPAGTFRIVVVGSSMALGQYVSQDQSFAELLPKELTAQGARKVEVYNAGMGFGFSHSTALRFKEALAAKPDMVLWIVTPTDISRGAEVLPEMNTDRVPGSTLWATEWHRLQDARAGRSLQDAAASLFSYTRTSVMLRHILRLSQSQTLNSAFKESNVEEGYLRAETPEAWQGFLRQFEKDDSDIAQQARSAGVPLAVAYVPGRDQAAMISAGTWPDGWDPYKLDHELRSTVTRQGEAYVDILQDFRSVPNPELDYFPVDGHLDRQGNALVASFLAKELTDGSVPALKARRASEAASAKRY